jgi:hypothetical protein
MTTEPLAFLVVLVLLILFAVVLLIWMSRPERAEGRWTSATSARNGAGGWRTVGA